MEVIARIETIFESITDSLLREEELTIPLRYKKAHWAPVADPDNDSFVELTKVSFPAKTPQEAWRFSEQGSDIT